MDAHPDRADLERFALDSLNDLLQHSLLIMMEVNRARRVARGE